MSWLGRLAALAVGVVVMVAASRGHAETPPVLDASPWLDVREIAASLTPKRLVQSDYGAAHCTISSPSQLSCRRLRLRTSNDYLLFARAFATRDGRRTASDVSIKVKGPSERDGWRFEITSLSWSKANGLRASDVTLVDTRAGESEPAALSVESVSADARRVQLRGLKWQRRSDARTIASAASARWRREAQTEKTSGWKVRGLRFQLARGLSLPVSVGSGDGRPRFGMLSPTVTVGRHGAEARWLAVVSSLNLLAGPVVHAFGPSGDVGLGGAVGVAAPSPRSASRAWVSRKDGFDEPVAAEFIGPSSSSKGGVVLSGDWHGSTATSGGAGAVATSGQLEEYNNHRLWSPYHRGTEGAFRDWRESTAGVGHRGSRHDFVFASYATHPDPTPGHRRWRFRFHGATALPAPESMHADAQLIYGGLHNPYTSQSDDRHLIHADSLVGWRSDGTGALSGGANLQIASEAELSSDLSNAGGAIGTATDSRTMLMTGGHVELRGTGRLQRLVHRLRFELSAAVLPVDIRDSGPRDEVVDGGDVSVGTRSMVGASPLAQTGDAAIGALLDQSLEWQSVELRLPFGAIGDLALSDGDLGVAPFGVATLDTDVWSASLGGLRKPRGRYAGVGDIRRRFGGFWIGYAYALGGRGTYSLFDIVYPGSRPSRQLRATGLLTRNDESFRSFHQLETGIVAGQWQASGAIYTETEMTAPPGATVSVARALEPLGWAVSLSGFVGGPTRAAGATLGVAAR